MRSASDAEGVATVMNLTRVMEKDIQVFGIHTLKGKA